VGWDIVVTEKRLQCPACKKWDVTAVLPKRGGLILRCRECGYESKAKPSVGSARKLWLKEKK